VRHITFEELSSLANELAFKIKNDTRLAWLRIYAVPRGGIPAALALMSQLSLMGIESRLVESAADATIIIDDLIDSGATCNRFDAPFYALIDKRTDSRYKDQWIVWPWEKDSDGSIEDNFRRILQFVGEDPNRGGLHETPKRVAKAWQFWCKGYNEKPEDILKTFEDGAEGCNEMVMVKDIPFYTHCEHHLAPFFGTATIAYIPNGKIVGLSKLNRVLDCFARRLQVQERLTTQVAESLMEHVDPIGVGVIVKARHMCIESRGTCQQGHHTVTSALRGAFKDDPTVRAEFLELSK
jgi:GTP cyclohydrolase I